MMHTYFISVQDLADCLNIKLNYLKAIGFVVSFLPDSSIMLYLWQAVPLQLGFKRQKTTGQVRRDDVFGPGGRHLIGPDYEFRSFQFDAHVEEYTSITVFAADRLQVPRAHAHWPYLPRTAFVFYTIIDVSC